jgi:hypothetical protein
VKIVAEHVEFRPDFKKDDEKDKDDATAVASEALASEEEFPATPVF